MANPTAEGSGTQAATVTTEHTLDDITGPGTYTLQVDLVNMVAADVVELRVSKMTLTGGTRRVFLFARFCDAQPADDTTVVSVPFATELTDAAGIRCTLKQTNGTSRNFPWSILKWS